jgi:hypothetical protein
MQRVAVAVAGRAGRRGSHRMRGAWGIGTVVVAVNLALLAAYGLSEDTCILAVITLVVCGIVWWKALCREG